MQGHPVKGSAEAQGNRSNANMGRENLDHAGRQSGVSSRLLVGGCSGRHRARSSVYESHKHLRARFDASQVNLRLVHFCACRHSGDIRGRVHLAYLLCLEV